MEHTSIGKLLLKLSPPVMLALLIQSVYNIVDSYFVAQYAPEGLTALSILFPVQLLMTALATGSGAGLNILVAHMDGANRKEDQQDVVKSGLWLGGANFVLFTLLGLVSLEGYFRISSDQAAVRAYGMEYGQIILLFSFGLFFESMCSKLLQAKGNMLLPMCAQVVGALLNVVLDPLLIFGYAGFPRLGVAGAAIATVVGQWAAMVIVAVVVFRRYPMKGKMKWGHCLGIYRAGLPSIVMQGLYTVYMIGLNLILKGFSEDAVTVLGIYYKLQTFFFIPLMGFQQVILPLVSFHFGSEKFQRVRGILRYALGISCVVMAVGLGVFLAIPELLLSIFSGSQGILSIGGPALRLISLSFVPAAVTMMLNVYFQGVELGKFSIAITVLRQIVLLVPLAWAFHFFGLTFVWLTFPVTELLSMAFALYLYLKKHSLPDRERFVSPKGELVRPSAS